MLLVYLVVGWFLGIWLASQWSLDWGVWLVGGLIGLGMGAVLRSRPSIALILACIGMIGLGGARYTAVQPTLNAHHIAYYNGTTGVTITGLVVDEPDVRDRSVNLRLAVEEMVLDNATAVPITGLIQVQTFRFPLIKYGTRLSLTGNLETPPEDEDFSYKDYLARQGVHSLMSLPEVTVLAEGEGHPIYHAIYAFKLRAEATINQLLPNPQAALLVGILLGNDNGMPPELVDAFRITGTSHIIAISG